MMFKEAIYSNLKSYPGICFMENTTKNLSQNFWSPDRYLKPEPPEYKTGLPTMGSGVRLPFTI
jgi:hypothetical protein